MSYRTTLALHAELKDNVISVNPFDIVEQARALDMALTLGEDDRQQRSAALRATVESRPIGAWSEGLLADFAEAVSVDGRTIERQ